MKGNTILILHRIPFSNIQYDHVIDHHHFHVVYIGSYQSLSDIPQDLSCDKWPVDLSTNWLDEVVFRVETQNLNVGYVMGMSEYQMEVAAILRARLSVQGATTHQVQLTRDKVLMKQAVAKAGIHVPFFCTLKQLLDNPETPELQKVSVVLKPKMGASSEDIKVFGSVVEVIDSVKNRNTKISAIDLHNNYDDFEVEAFVTGSIWHVDGFTNQGIVQHSEASQYVGNCLAYAQGHAFGSIQMSMPKSLADFTQNVVSALGIECGSFHLEVFNHEDQWIFLEIGHRCGGADVVQTFLLKTGVNLYHAHIITQLDLHVPIVVNRNDNFYGWFVFPGHHINSDYARIDEVTTFKNHPYVVRWNQLKHHMRLTKRITYQRTEVPIAGVICCPTPAQGEAFLIELFNGVSINELSIVEEPNCEAI